MKHVCPYPDCGRVIAWDLLFCWEHNERLRETGGTVRAADGTDEFPAYRQH
jgi:hypothetical protein